jgi:hypothetical protein
MTVRVTGPDEISLHRICQELVERIRGTRDLAIRHNAAVELANVSDGVVVGYIAQVINFTDTVDGVLISALARMATLESESILAEMAQSKNEGRAAQATNALHTLTVNRLRF